MRVANLPEQSRDVALVRRFAHGAGGTSLVRVDGVVLALKACATPSPLSTHLPAALERMSTMKTPGIPVPLVVDHGVADGYEFLFCVGQCPGTGRRRSVLRCSTTY